MKLQLATPSFARIVGFLLTAPAAYFLFVSVLKYVFGMPALYDASEPLLKTLGVNKPMGWNINLLIVFGPVLAFLLNLSAILSLEWKQTEDALQLHLSFQRKPANFIAVFISGSCMAVIFLYALAENCHC